MVRERALSALESVPTKQSSVIAIGGKEFILGRGRSLALAPNAKSDEWSDAFIHDWNTRHR